MEALTRWLSLSLLIIAKLQDAEFSQGNYINVLVRCVARSSFFICYEFTYFRLSSSIRDSKLAWDYGNIYFSGGFSSLAG